MSLQPSSWSWKSIAGWLVTAIAVIALAHPIIHFLQGVLTALDGAIPGGK